MAAFIVDASVTLAWCFADEASAATNALVDRLRAGDEAVVPARWPLEVGNAILIAARRQHITLQCLLRTPRGVGMRLRNAACPWRAQLGDQSVLTFVDE